MKSCEEAFRLFESTIAKLGKCAKMQSMIQIGLAYNFDSNSLNIQLVGN